MLNCSLSCDSFNLNLGKYVIYLFFYQCKLRDRIYFPNLINSNHLLPDIILYSFL